MTRVVALIDGEHHPAAVRAALGALRVSGHEVVGAVFCGGTEKVDPGSLDDAYGVEVRAALSKASDGPSAADLAPVLRGALVDMEAHEVVDITDEPILSPADRFFLASVTLSLGACYRGADFDLRPVSFAEMLTKPSVSVYATGKRTGKTAVAGALARHAAKRGRQPVIVAVGRGGPDPPRIIEAGAALDPATLLGWADAGLHASSDYVEDAVMSGATTIGCVRAGGGLAGATLFSNLPAAARMAEERPEDFVVLEGSGASIPEVAAKSRLVCVPATLEPAEVTGFLNPYRLLLADLCVVTMAQEASAAARVRAAVQGIAPELDVLTVAFRPDPVASVRGRKVFVCSTAPVATRRVLGEHLEREHGCEVVGMTHKLSDRSALARDIAAAPAHDVLLTELKASAVDVAARQAAARSTEVVFMNNLPVAVDGSLEQSFDRLLQVASG